MNVERGFLRLTIAVSVLLLIGGIAIDVVRPPSGWIVDVALRDGRKATLDLQHWKHDAIFDKDLLADEAAKVLPRDENRPVLLRRISDGAVYVYDLDRNLLIDIPAGFERVTLIGEDIANFTVRRSWKFDDAVFTVSAVGVAALLWLTFFTARWIGRGFAT